MIHHDYLLRLIEQYLRALANISELRTGRQPDKAGGALDRELRQLLAADRQEILRLSTMELLARVLRSGASYEARTRALFLVSLLKESGDLALESGDEAHATASHVQALRLMLELEERPDEGDCPQFVPTVEAIAAAVPDEALPADVRALLMRHHERNGDFAKAEDCLFGLLDRQAPSPDLFAFGSAYYERLLELNDASLERGNLPRSEVLEGLAELRRRAVA